MKNPKTYGLTHIALVVRDLEKTLKFYTYVFDMEVMYHKDDFIQLTTPGCHDILVFEKNKDSPIGKGGGIIHLGFRLRDPNSIDDIVERIKSAGGKVKDQGEFVPGSPYVFFEDLDGYEVEVWYELLPSVQ